MNKENLSTIRVILLAGEDFQRSERLSSLIAAVVDYATRDFNLDVFNQETFSIESLSGLIVTFPMIAERRVIVIKDFDKLKLQTRKKASEIIKDTPDTTLVIVEGEKAALSPKPPSKHFKTEKFKQIYESNLPSWIQNRFTKRGKKVNSNAVALLINNIGTVLRELDNEIEKITIASQHNETIDDEDVSRVVGSFRHDTVWNLCNAIGLGDFSGAVRILTNLMESEKNRETFYIATITSHLMKIAEYNNLIKKGIPHKDAMKTLTESPFLWKLNKLDAQTKNFSGTDVRSILTALTRAESTIKKYGINKQLLMELLIPFVVPKAGKAGAK